MIAINSNTDNGLAGKWVELLDNAIITVRPKGTVAIMSTAVQSTETNQLVIHFGPMLKNVSDDDFFEFCRINRDWRIERTSNGEIILMTPTGGESGGRNFYLTGTFFGWVKADGTGKGFDSS